MRYLLLAMTLALSFNAKSQLPNGSIAPDFTLVDYYGNTHNLYSYLDSGKTVFLEFFAAHCPTCWNYHQTHRLQNMYNWYGPDSTGEIMVLALEYDEYNDSNAFTGNHDPWVTAGNWLDGTPYPLFNVEWPDRGVFDDYNTHIYPVVYKICPDKIVERITLQTSEAILYQKVQGCQTISIGEENHSINFYFNPISKKAYFNSTLNINSIHIYNLQGKLIKSIKTNINSEIDMNGLREGVYLFEINAESKTVVKKAIIF